MRVFFYSITLVLLISFNISAQDLSTNSGKRGALEWSSSTFKKKFDKFQRRYLIEFVAVNKSTNPLKIERVEPSCYTCVDLSVTESVLGPNQSSVVSGFVVPRPQEKLCTGQIKVQTDEPHVYDLSYEIEVPDLYFLDPPELVWLDTREQRFFELELNSEVGASLQSVEVSDNSFKVESEKLPSGNYKIGVTPSHQGRMQGVLTLKLMTPNLNNPYEVFVNLALEEFSKVKTTEASTSQRNP